MASTSRRDETTVGADGLRIWSCVICRRRKVRCDRHEPCANCVRNSIECHYPVTGRLPRRRNPPTEGQGTKTGKHSELIRRLRRLEAVVTELSAQVEEGAGDVGLSNATSWQIPLPGQDMPVANVLASHLSSDDSTAVGRQTTASRFGSSQDDDGLDEDFGSLVVAQNGVVHVGNRFWTIFCDEVHNIFDAVDDVEDDGTEATTVSRPADTNPNHVYLFGSTGEVNLAGFLSSLHGMLPFFWQSFANNVDPFIKILHVPSMNHKVQTSIESPTSISPEDWTLFIAISLAAVISLDDDLVASKCGLPKQQAITQYRSCLEKALEMSRLVTSRSMTLLQAFVIYLTVLPYVGLSDEVWPLVGLLLRIATRLGLHRDASHNPNFSVLEGEMRRRLWWQICLIDSRSRDSNAAQLSISSSMFDTAKPANIDDEKLESMSSSFDIGSESVTNMTLFLIRCDLWHLSRSIEHSRDQTLQTHLNMVRTARHLIEATHLKQSDSTKPFDKFVNTATCLFFAKIDSMLYSQAAKQASTTKSDKLDTSNDASKHVSNGLIRSSSEIVKNVSSLLSSPTWVQWRWQIKGQRPWLAMGIVLEHIVCDKWDQEKEDLWKSLKQVEASLCFQQGDLAPQKRLDELMRQAEHHRRTWQSQSTRHPNPEKQFDHSHSIDGNGQASHSDLESLAWSLDTSFDLAPLMDGQDSVSNEVFGMLFDTSVW